MVRALLQHDRLLVFTGLVAVILLAWVYLLRGAALGMDGMEMGGGQMVMMTSPWTARYAALIFVMWAVMMVAMMLPSVAPTILLAVALMRPRGGDHILGPAGLFVSGYLAVWFGFSLAATALQWGFDQAGLLSSDMASGSVILVGFILIAAGLYQWTSLKQACLIQCRSPYDHLVRYWRQGSMGPMVAGVRHGVFCLGCCWVLMALLFVGGVMNVLWIAALALLVLIEKLFPHGSYVSRFTGIVLVAWGSVVLIH